MQLLLSLVPSLDASAVGSAIGALMSAGYSILALVRSTVEVANGELRNAIISRVLALKMLLKTRCK